MTNGVLNNLELSQCQQCQDGQQIIGQCLTASQNIQESLSKRYCNGIMGVPITFIDKLNPEQFNIIGLAPERSTSDQEKLQIKRYKNAIQHKKDGSVCCGNKVNDGPTILHKNVPNKFPYYTSETVNNKYLEVLYARVLIQKVN